MDLVVHLKMSDVNGVEYNHELAVRDPARWKDEIKDWARRQYQFHPGRAFLKEVEICAFVFIREDGRVVFINQNDMRGPLSLDNNQSDADEMSEIRREIMRAI